MTLKQFFANIPRFRRDYALFKGTLKPWPRLVLTVFIWVFGLPEASFTADSKSGKVQGAVFTKSKFRSQQIISFIDEMLKREESLKEVMR